MWMLEKYFAPDWHYCEFYTPIDCCRRVPCGRSHAASAVTIQKSHDFKLELSPAYDCIYLIQARHIIPQTISNFELWLRTGRGEDTREQFREHALNWLAYYKGFVNKWGLGRPGRHLVVHERLLRAPAAELAQAIRFLDASRPLDHKRLDHLIELNPPRILNDFRSFRHFDRQFLSDLEQQAFRELALLGLEPIL
jgi:hypothetical protein